MSDDGQVLDTGEAIHDFVNKGVQRPPVDQDVLDRLYFMDNVREARENGYDLVCVECGVGVTDDSDIHESRCSLYVAPTSTNHR